MSEIRPICPNCGKALPPDVPLGLCPQCLVKSALGAEPGAAGPDFAPPPVAEMAQLFPQFEILGFIGKGGMGAVYKARQPALDRFIALKILPPAIGNDPSFAERFTREARALARLNHPNIVTVYDFGRASAYYYLAMEFVDGQNLRQIVHGGRLAPESLLYIVPQICDALQFAHDEGVVHRDIKPENILLDQKGRVKIADFGIAKIVGAAVEKLGLTGAKDIVGTPHYMAPEQIERPNAVDHRADIYSLGVVFYELLTGELPLGKFLPPSSKVRVDVRFDDVVLRALEKEPERRYQHVREVKTATQVLESPPPLPPAPIESPMPAPPPQHAEGPAGSGGKIALMTAGVVLLALTVVALLLYAHLSTTRHPFNAPPFEQVQGGDHAVAAELPALHYRWTTGENCVYALQFESDTEDDTETMTGNVIYDVKAISGEVATLTYRNQMGAPQHHPKPGRAAGSLPPHFWPRSPFGLPRQLQVDATGHLQESSGQAKPLPQALGNVEDLIFEPLPWRDQSAWTAEGDCVILQTHVVPLALRARVGRVETTTFPAHEKASYQIRATEKGSVQIQKRYDLQTQEQVGGQPRMQLTGEGTITFDTTLGLPRTMEFKGVFTEISTNTTRRTPLTLSYRLLEDREKTNVLTPPTAPPMAPKELAAAELRRALIDLKSADSGRKQRATALLAGAKPTESEHEVVAALIPVLGDANWAVRQNAARALGVWTAPEAYQPLVKALDDSQSSVRWAVIDALSHRKDAPTAAVLTNQMSHGMDIQQAGQALRAIGAAAEAAAAGLLGDRNQQVRYEACRVLKEIGTRQSVPALTSAASDADGVMAMLAEEALNAIDARP